jgi:hypothetical protein
MQKNNAKFRFSQSMLEDWLACRQRFYLRHIAFLEWPELETDQYVEQRRRTQKGLDFHHLMEKVATDVPTADISKLEMDPVMRQWWDNFVTAAPLDIQNATFYPEITLSVVLGGYLFIAKCDLIAVLPDGRIQIWDWKTAAKLPRRDQMGKHTQTRLYQLLATLVGQSLTDGKLVTPEQVEMIYWFPNFPERSMRFAYNAQDLARDDAYFRRLAAEISAVSSPDDFFKSADLKACKYCQFRSYCDRGTTGGSLDDFDDVEAPAPATVDWEAVPEIEL